MATIGGQIGAEWHGGSARRVSVLSLHISRYNEQSSRIKIEKQTIKKSLEEDGNLTGWFLMNKKNYWWLVLSGTHNSFEGKKTDPETKCACVYECVGFSYV